MADNFFTTESEDLLREFKQEHKENFINSPGLNKLVDGSLPLSRRQLKRKLYNPNTSYPVGKVIEYYLEGKQALELTTDNSVFVPQDVSFSGLMNNLYDAIDLYRENCNPGQLDELKQLRREFIASDYNYETGKQVENFIQ